MTNPNNLKQLSESLSEILNTPVSEEVLKLTTEPQRNLIASLIYKWKIGEDHREQVIYSILNQAKQKIKKEHSDKTKFYIDNRK